MKRPLFLVLAAALVAGTMVAGGATPAAAQGVGVTMGVGNWDNDRWHSDNWRFRNQRHFRRDFGPGFRFGVPASRAFYRDRFRDRDCWRDWSGRVVCQRPHYRRTFGPSFAFSSPNFSFSFGAPARRAFHRPGFPDRDCWRDWSGRMVCRRW
jgi:hypothetical protein